MCHVEGLPDSGDSVMYGSGRLRTLNSQEDGIPCLMRLEFNLSLAIVRVTTRSIHPKVVSSIMHLSNLEIIGWSS
jgi:hypothetical protein